MTVIRQQDVTTPHFGLPFRFSGVGGRPIMNEQDEIDDVVDCIKAILAYPEGSHQTIFEFGSPDVVHRGNSDSIVLLLQTAIREWEPRADVLLVERPDVIDTLIRQVIVNLHSGEAT